MMSWVSGKRLRVLATMSLAIGPSVACGDASIDSDIVEELDPIEVVDEGSEPLSEPDWNVSDEAFQAHEAFGEPPEAEHPPYWLPWTTDGAPGVQSDARFLVGGLRCSGRYCDNVGLLSVETKFKHGFSWWTDYFSEEGNNERICSDNGFVTGIRCDSNYCDKVSLRCSTLEGGAVRSNCFWTTEVSEEGGGKFIAPDATYLAGVRCSGRYCDDKELLFCQAKEDVAPIDLDAQALRFAPRLRFDQLSGTGSGSESKCFTSDPGTYYEQRALGVAPVALCNKDYSTIQNDQVPTYYVATQIGPRTSVIRYWYFYAWQSSCFLSAGSHAADWEAITVLVVDGELQRVAFHQHGGWYSRELGGFQVVEGTHPVGYVGKNSHGTYHDDGGSGGCLYFEDYRNPGGKNYHQDTWNNLQPLIRGPAAPDWMNCTGSGCFDGVGHPLEQNGELRTMAGCRKDGCQKSSVGGKIPFMNDPLDSDFVSVYASHSGRVLDVFGESRSDGAIVHQYSNLSADNQRWMLESTGDGYFTMRSRHAGKCMDVSSASPSSGANVIQYSCNGRDHQRFKLSADDEGTFEIQAKHSQQCLLIKDAAMSDGGQLIQSPCDGSANSRFSFVR